MVLIIVLGSIIFFLCIIVLLFVLIKIEVNGKISLSEAQLDIKIRLLCFTIINLQIPNIDVKPFPFKILMKKKSQSPLSKDTDTIVEGDPEKWLDEMKDLTSLLKDLVTDKKQILKVIKVRKLSWETSVGFGEAPLTAVIVGVIWTIKANFLKIADDLVAITNQPAIQVHPYFQTIQAETKFSCMTTIRLGQAITAGYRIMKYWKGRHQSSCQNTQYKA